MAETVDRSGARRRLVRRLGVAALAVGLVCPAVDGDVVEAEGGKPSAYSFIGRVNGRPVHWDKCQAIRWRINPAGAPRGALAELKEAVRRLEKVSGLNFRYLGRTKAKARPFGPYPARYPRDTRLVIDWASPRQEPAFRGSTAGFGGGTWYGNGEMIQGFLLLNTKFNDFLADGFGRGPTKGHLYMHELGHAVGLGHVRDPHQIMYPVINDVRDIWGLGDRNGLKWIGKRQPCFASVAGSEAADQPAGHFVSESRVELG